MPSEEKPHVAQVLLWIASTLAIVGTGAWTVFVYFRPPAGQTPQAAPQTQTGGSGNTQINAGGNVTINTLPGPHTPPRNAADAARAELQTLGIPWGSQRFVAAIVDGDIRGVDLFLKGGMTLDINYEGASAAIYTLQPAANNRKAVMQRFLESGFDPNATLLDARVMRSLGSLPPPFEHPLLPKEYAAWQHVFAGPADLWLVIRACYAGAASDDFDLLSQLSGRGARFELSLAFLKAYERTWGETPACMRVRNEVERLAKMSTR